VEILHVAHWPITVDNILGRKVKRLYTIYGEIPSSPG